LVWVAVGKRLGEIGVLGGFLSQRGALQRGSHLTHAALNAKQEPAMDDGDQYTVTVVTSSEKRAGAPFREQLRLAHQ
jgi:hypothetical protein